MVLIMPKMKIGNAKSVEYKKQLTMKRIILFSIYIVLICGLTGCLNHGLDDIDTYHGADITSMEGVYYRYTTDKVMNVSGEPQVKQIALKMVKQAIDPQSATVEVTIEPTVNFPSEELKNLSSENLVVCLNISVASIIRPVEGSVKLGIPGDWSHPNVYEITAADKTKKRWTVSVNLNK